eukprot:9506246-Alexandrium_andersonii.AAC.1
MDAAAGIEASRLNHHIGPKNGRHVLPGCYGHRSFSSVFFARQLPQLLGRLLFKAWLQHSTSAH